MGSLAQRTWFFATLVLALGAIGVEACSKHNAAAGSLAAAQRAGDAGSRAESTTGYSGLSGLWSIAGVFLALSAIGCWLRSRAVREPGPQSLPMLILSIYLMQLLLMV